MLLYARVQKGIFVDFLRVRFSKYFSFLALCTCRKLRPPNLVIRSIVQVWLCGHALARDRQVSKDIMRRPYCSFNYPKGTVSHSQKRGKQSCIPAGSPAESLYLLLKIYGALVCGLCMQPRPFPGFRTWGLLSLSSCLALRKDLSPVNFNLFFAYRVGNWCGLWIREFCSVLDPLK